MNALEIVGLVSLCSCASVVLLMLIGGAAQHVRETRRLAKTCRAVERRDERGSYVVTASTRFTRTNGEALYYHHAEDEG